MRCMWKKSTSLAYDQHRRSGYLRCTACHVGDDGTNRSQLVATLRATMSTAMLQKLKLSSSRRSRSTMMKRTLTYAAYVYQNLKREGAHLRGFAFDRKTVLIGLIKLITFRIFFLQRLLLRLLRIYLEIS